MESKNTSIRRDASDRAKRRPGSVTEELYGGTQKENLN